MVAIKANDVEAFLAKPPSARPIVLVFGPDAGLVRERVEKLISASVDDPKDPFALAHLEGDALSAEPSRLVEEAHTVPLFGGRRAVWIKSGSRPFVAAVETVIASPPTDCRIVIEAGELRRTSPLRAVCEKAPCAAAIACYVDNEENLGRLVDAEMREARLTIAPDARVALISLIGGDRAASRSEIRKLALYAHGRDRVVLDDVVAVVADASALGVDAVIDAAFAGRASETEAQFSKAVAAGTAAGTILSWALRYVTQLHKARVTQEAGADNFTVMRSFIPPIHFSRAPQVQAALQSWTASALESVMAQLADAMLNVRRTNALADALAQRALLMVAQQARRQR